MASFFRLNAFVCYFWLFTIIFVNSAHSQQRSAEGLLEVAIARLNTTSDVNKLKELSKEIQKYISSPKNKKQMSTESGQQLINIQSKLVNYFSLKSKFDECISNKNSKLLLDKRMLETFLKSDTKLQCKSPANALVGSMSNLEDIVKKMKVQYGAGVPLKSTKWNWETAKDLRDDIIQRGYRDALKTYLDLNHRYILSDGKNDKNSMKTIVCNLFENKICAPGSTGMHRLDSYTTSELEKYGNQYLQQLKKHVKPISTEAVRKNLNEHFNAIENAYQKVPPKSTTGRMVEGQGFSESDFQAYKNKGGAHAWVQDQMKINAKHDAKRKQKIKEYEAWYKSYLSSMTKYPSGSLVFTDEISKYFASPMQYEDGNQKVNFKRIPNRMVVEKSIIEAKSQLKKFGHFLSDKHYTKSYMTKHVLTTNEIKDQIKDLVKYAPAAASQVLVNNPAYAPLMCDAINCVNKDQMIVDKKAENADRNMMIWGGVIVAGAVVTGGASIALAAAAPAVAAVAAATSTGFVIGGTVLGASSGVYYANRADEINQDYTKLKAAFIGTGAKDLDAWRVMSDQLNDLEEAKFNMYMAVGFTALDVASFGSLLKGLSSIERMRAVSKAVEMMDVGKWSPVRNARMIKIVQNGGEEGASKLFTVLSQFGKDQKYIDEFLLKASKLSKPELNKLIKNIDLALKEENGAQKAYSLMEQFHSRQKEIVVTAKKTEVKTKVKEIEPIQKGSPVTPEITASSESKYLTREEMDELHTHDNPVWKSESWTDETSRLMKHEPDAEMIQNEAFILQTDEKYSYVEERVLKESKQKITEHSGEYSTISMDARKLAGDAILDKKHFTEIEQKAHQVTIVDGKLYDAEGKLLDSRGFHTGNEAGQDHVIFVMDQKGNIFVGGEKGVYTDKANRQIYHSQLAGGKDVAAAGELKVVDGKIVGFTDRSGHYMPTPRLSLQFLEEAKKKGATLKEIEIDIHSMKTPGSNKTVEPVKAAVKNEEKLLGSGGNTLIYQGSDQSVRRVPRSQDEETKKAFWEYVQGTTESKKLGIPVIEHQYTVVSDGKDYLRYDGKSVIKSDAKGNPLGGETAKEISLEKLKNTYQPVFTSVPEVDMKQAVKVDDYLTELSSYRKMDAKAMTPEQLAKKAELEKKYPKFLEFVDQTAEFSKIGDFATHQAVFDPKTGDVLIMDLSSNQKKMKLIEGKGWYEYSTNNPSDLKLIKNQDKNIWSPYLKGGDYDPKTAQEIQERINSKRSNFQLNQKN